MIVFKKYIKRLIVEATEITEITEQEDAIRAQLLLQRFCDLFKDKIDQFNVYITDVTNDRFGNPVDGLATGLHFSVTWFAVFLNYKYEDEPTQSGDSYSLFRFMTQHIRNDFKTWNTEEDIPKNDKIRYQSIGLGQYSLSLDDFERVLNVVKSVKQLDTLIKRLGTYVTYRT